MSSYNNLQSGYAYKAGPSRVKPVHVRESYNIANDFYALDKAYSDHTGPSIVQATVPHFTMIPAQMVASIMNMNLRENYPRSCCGRGGVY